MENNEVLTLKNMEYFKYLPIGREFKVIVIVVFITHYILVCVRSKPGCSAYGPGQPPKKSQP